jgi:hypothetical protein
MKYRCTVYCTLFKFNILLGGFPGRIDALQSCSILLKGGEPVLVLVDGVLYVHPPFRFLRRFGAIGAAGSGTVRCAVRVVSAAAERTVQAAHRRSTRAEQEVGSAAVLLAGYTAKETTTMELDIKTK